MDNAILTLKYHRFIVGSDLYPILLVFDLSQSRQSLSVINGLNTSQHLW